MHCTFVLNRLPTSSLICNAGWFTAFSGDGQHRNNPDSQNMANNGPIPAGTYYIVDRPSGGVLGPIRDYALGRDEWFALYRDDGTIDDAMFVQSVRRGQFRLHPLGPSGTSKGCVVVQHPAQFEQLRAHLLRTPVMNAPGTAFRMYGMLEVALLATDRVAPPAGSSGSAARLA
jgi:Protein of unknown function (DUF2778)